MTEQAPVASVYAANLLRFYSFDLGERTIADLLAQWQADHPEDWVRLAVIEALYQGRYKAVSVEQILAFWRRRGQPLHHFNHDFERLVCNKLPRNLSPSHRLPEPSSSDRSRPQSNVVNFPASFRRPEPTPAIAIDPPETITPPEAPETGKFPSARLREVLQSDSELAASANNDRPSPPRSKSSLSQTLATQKPSVPEPLKKAAPLIMPDFGLTAPHLSLKLRIQLAALYHPNWIVAVESNPLIRRSIHRSTQLPKPVEPDSQPIAQPKSQSEPVKQTTPAEKLPSPIDDDLTSDLW